MTERAEPFSAEELANRAVAIDFIPSKRRDDHPETRALMRDWRRWLATLAERDKRIAELEARIPSAEREADAMRMWSDAQARIATLEAALRIADEDFRQLGQIGHDLDKVLTLMCDAKERIMRALSPPTGAEVGGKDG